MFDSSASTHSVFFDRASFFRPRYPTKPWQVRLGVAITPPGFVQTQQGMPVQWNLPRFCTTEKLLLRSITTREHTGTHHEIQLIRTTRI